MAELFKFRCYQCQKLIGAPASKLGKIVKCPKCGVDLLVPSPDDENPAESDAGSDPDAFRPEDLGIQIEPERLSRPASAASLPPEPAGADPVAFLSQLEASEEPPGEEGEPSTSSPEPPEDAPAEEPDFSEPEVEPLVARRRTRTAAQVAVQMPRARDVVLPRTAVGAWAMFALLGLAFAFLTGLLLGQRLGR